MATYYLSLCSTRDDYSLVNRACTLLKAKKYNGSLFYQYLGKLCFNFAVTMRIDLLFIKAAVTISAEQFVGFLIGKPLSLCKL